MCVEDYYFNGATRRLVKARGKRCEICADIVKEKMQKMVIMNANANFWRLLVWKGEDSPLSPMGRYGMGYPAMAGSSFCAVLPCLRIWTSQVLLQVCLGISGFFKKTWWMFPQSMREAGKRINRAVYPCMHHLMWEHSLHCQVYVASGPQWDGHKTLDF